MKEKFCTIYLVRHGVTQANVLKKTQRPSEPLNATGFKQAQKIAKKFAKLHFAAAYSSDLMRAKQTAETIAKTRKLEVSLTKMLRERFPNLKYGESLHDRKDLQEIYKKYLKLSPDKQWQTSIWGGESNEEVVGRAFTYLRGLAEINQGKTILVVTHSAAMKILLAHLGYLKRGDVEKYVFKNTGYAILQSDGLSFNVKRVVGLVLKKVIV